jgi:hypothetical protein
MATTTGFVGMLFTTFVSRTNSMFFNAQPLGANLSRSFKAEAEEMN